MIYDKNSAEWKKILKRQKREEQAENIHAIGWMGMIGFVAIYGAIQFINWLHILIWH